MGYPADKMESLYRNNREDVKKYDIKYNNINRLQNTCLIQISFFKKMHGEHYKIYNLCSEREYDQSEFPNFAYFPFEDH